MNQNIIFLHNGGASSTIWRHLSDHLKEHYNVFLIDLPGYGNSNEKALTLEGYVDFLGSYIIKNKITLPILIGNCMGSAISHLYSLKNPDKVRCLILFNPLTIKTFKNGSLGYLLRIDRYSSIFDNILPIVSSIKMPYIIISKIIDMQISSEGSFYKDLINDIDLRECYSRTENIKSLRSLLKEIPKMYELGNNTQTFVILGSRNKILSPEKKLVEFLNPKLIISLENCGHLPMLEDPQKVISITDRILKNEIRSRL
jgi:pimeloyl-ACP methyl ester carboxylesterase